MGKKSKRIDITGERQELGGNPFDALESAGLPDNEGPSSAATKPASRVPSKKSRGRVDVVRQRSAGSGGWMTVAKNFVGISLEEKNALKRSIQKRCGVGGTLKNGNIEIQGDLREKMREVLESAGFRVVFAGG